MRRAVWVCVAGVGISLALRVLYLLQPWRVDCATLPLWLGDEGSTAILALHILSGLRPALMSGAYHLGTFDCYTTALALHGFGTSLLAVRLVAHAGAFVSALLTFFIGRKVYGTYVGFLAATLVVLPSHFVFLWSAMTLVPNTSFTAAILLVLYTTLLLMEQPGWKGRIVAGFAWGFALWESLLGGAYVAVSAGAVALRAGTYRKGLAPLALGFVLGASPLIYANLTDPLVSIAQVVRKGRHAVSMAEDVQQQGRREYRGYPLLQVLGAQGEGVGPWLPLGAVGALFLAVGLSGGIRQCCANWKEPGFHQQALLVSFVAVGILEGVSGFTGQPVGRYHLPMFPVLVVLATGWAARAIPRFALATVGVVALCNAITIAVPPSCTGVALPDDIISVLKQNGLRYGYAAGQMYDIMLRSNEEIVIIPLEHSRFPRDEQRVAAADHVFYAFRTDQEDKPVHQTFINFLRANNVQHRETAVENFHVWYDFEPRAKLSHEAITKLIEEFRYERWGR
jgi:hypothetical protein